MDPGCSLVSEGFKCCTHWSSWSPSALRKTQEGKLSPHDQEENYLSHTRKQVSLTQADLYLAHWYQIYVGLLTGGPGGPGGPGSPC